MPAANAVNAKLAFIDITAVPTATHGLDIVPNGIVTNASPIVFG